MYGKVFEDLFCSTLMDHGGDTAYVFIAMIVLSDEQGYIKHTENSLARLICKPIEAVKEAIKNLEAPDPESNIKAYDGRRIVPLRELMDDETRGWMVVNKEVYRDRASKEDKRKSDRDRIAKKRLENSSVANSRNASHSVADVAHTDTDTNTDVNPLWGFDKFWTAWPKNDRKESRGKCEEVWKKKGFEKSSDSILAHVDGLKVSAQWKREGGRYIPAPLVYLNQRRWEGAEAPQAKVDRWTP